MTKHSNLSFELLTDPELIRFTHLQNAQVWKSKLTAEEYADREWYIGCDSKIGQRDTVKNLGLFHFVLRDLNIPAGSTGTDNVVASCETMNRPAWRAEPNGELRETVCSCIGGVYTLPQHRQKGYAAEMIKSLNRYWDDRLSNDGFMFLYSEIGDYYSKFDYVSFPVPVHELALNQEYQTSVDSRGFHYIKYEDYTKLVAHQSSTIQDDLIHRAKINNKTTFTLIPSQDIFSWFHDRDIFTSKKLRPELNIEHFGAILNDGSFDHVVWLHDWNDDHIFIVKLSASSYESYKNLIDITIEEARLYNFGKICVWDSALGDDAQIHAQNVDFIKSFPNSKLFKENSSRSAFRPLDKSDPSSYIWANNEKWCWF